MSNPEKIQPKKNRKEAFALLRRLLAYTLPYRQVMGLILFLILAMSLLFNYPPVLIRNAIDRWIDNTGISYELRIQGLIRTGLFYLLLTVAGSAVRYVQSIVAAWVGQRIVRDLRRTVFNKVLSMPRQYFDTTPVGRLMTRVTSDVDTVQHFVSEGVVGALADIFMFLGVVVFMLYISPLLFLTLFSIIPFMVLAFILSNTRLRDANRDIRKAQSALNTNVQEALTGMTTIQLFNREHTATEIFQEHNQNMKKACFREVRWFSFYFPVLELTQALSTILVLGVGGWCILSSRAGITLGILIAFLTYVRDFFRPLDGLSNRAGMLQQALASCERIFDLLDEPEPLRDPEHPVEHTTLRGHIEFDHVWFAYKADNWVLKDVSFSINPGETLAIVGATGSGKTTLINLIMRFYDVQKGSIRLDGIDVRNYTRYDLRRHIGAVVQEPFVFSSSVAENISLLDPSISRVVIEQTARYVNADTFIRKMPSGYDTVLNERGGGLSAGQKQLLALARAIAQNRDAILILDEATANVDSETEALIQDALIRVMETRTGIVIAHRLSTISHADRILVLYQGRLTASGTHAELIEQDGYYRRLYDYLALSEER